MAENSRQGLFPGLAEMVQRMIRHNNSFIFPRLAAILTFLIASIAFAGWLFSIPLLKSVVPNANTMKPNTILCLALSAMALFLICNHPSKRQMRLAQAFATVVAIVGIATAIQFLSGWNFGIDQLLFRDAADQFTPYAGRMSQLAAVSFSMLGVALAIKPCHFLRPVLWMLASLVTLIGAISLLGYLWNVSDLVTGRWLAPLAFNSGVCLVLLGSGTIISSWESWQSPFVSTSMEKKILAGFFGTLLLLATAGGYVYQLAAKSERLASDLELKQLTERVAILEHDRYVTLLALVGTLVITIGILVTLFLGIRREMIKRGELESMLQEKASSLSAIFESVVDGIITIDARGTVESINPSAGRIFGYAPEEVVGRNIKMLMPEPYHGEHDGYLGRYCSAGSPHIIGKTLEVVGLRKDGTTFPMLLSVSEMTLHAERHFTGIVQDITARKRAETSVRESEALLRRLLDISPIGVRILRLSDRQRVFSNKAYGDVFRTTQEVLLHADPALYYQDPQEYHEICRQLDRGEDVINRKIVLLGGNGESVWAIASFIRIQFEGEPADLAWFYDVTPIHQAQDKAEQASQLKTDFLSSMSHEIRTPLTGLLGMLEVLSLTKLDLEQKLKVNAAWSSARSLLRIVNDILDWSKIEEGKLHLAPQATSIEALMGEVINTYSRAASAKNLNLRCHTDPRLSQAHIVDPLRLSQILNNFVSNAIKFTREGEVDLRADLLEQVESGELIRFSVRDTGVGILPEVQGQLFKRYQQGSADTARMYGGTGLGLAICQRLAEMMDGRLELDSTPGSGSTFSFTVALPVSAEVVKMVSSEHLEVEQRAVTPLFGDEDDAPRILAVDDHPTNRDLLANQLRLLGLKVDTAEHGREAFSLWRTGGFDLVITDCHMPEMDGYTLSSEIRRVEQIHGLPRVPIIAWTANALPEESEKCRAAGMDHLMVKPISMAQLKNTLASFFPGRGEETSSPTEAVQVSNASPIDYALLGQVVPDSAMQKRVLGAFRSHIHSDHDVLCQHFMSEDLVGIEKTAHRMKGSSMMVGARALAAACHDIERAAYAGDMGVAKTLQEPLAGVLSSLDAYLLQIAGVD